MTDLDALALVFSVHERQIKESGVLLKACSENIVLATALLKMQQVRLEILEEKVNLLQRQLKGDGGSSELHPSS